MSKTLGTLSTLSDVIGKIADSYRDDGEKGMFSKLAAKGQNYTNISKSKISEHAQTQGFWDAGWVGKMGVIGSAGSQVMGTLLVFKAIWTWSIVIRSNRSNSK